MVCADGLKLRTFMDKRFDQTDQRIIRIESKLDRFHWSVLAGLGVVIVQSVLTSLL